MQCDALSVSDMYGYNSLGEVTSYVASLQSGVGSSATGVYEVHYVRDALGRITAKTEGIGGVTSSYSYAYDPAGRLTDVTANGTATAHYEYDLNGNRVSDANNDGVLSFNQSGTLLDATYDDQDRLLATDHGPLSTSYSYTANGELLSKTDTSTNTSTTYTYDALGNLTHVTLPTGDVIDYIVDGQNRRVGKALNGAPVQGWLYDGQLKVVGEVDGSGAVVSRFVYGSKVDVPDYVIQGGVTYRILSDHLGSARLVLNAGDGTVVQRTDYDEFGNVLVDNVAPGFQRLPFGFAGGLYDTDTGLVRFGARDYDPETGRWTAKDPIGFGGRDPNLYGYVMADPVNLKDGTGEFGEWSLTGVAAFATWTAFVGYQAYRYYAVAQPRVQEAYDNACATLESRHQLFRGRSGDYGAIRIPVPLLGIPLWMEVTLEGDVCAWHYVVLPPSTL